MKKLTVLGVLALVVIASLAIGGVALAQGPAGQATQNGNVGCGMVGAGGAFRFGANGQSVADSAATLFKMTRDELVAELQAGKAILDVAKEKGLTAADVAKAVVDVRSAAVDAAVAAGRITQAQADLMIENMTENVTSNIESGVQCGLGAGAGCGSTGQGSTGRGGMMGGRGGRGGTMGGRGNAQSSTSL